MSGPCREGSIDVPSTAGPPLLTLLACLGARPVPGSLRATDTLSHASTEGWRFDSVSIDIVVQHRAAQNRPDGPVGGTNTPGGYAPGKGLPAGIAGSTNATRRVAEHIEKGHDNGQ